MRLRRRLSVYLIGLHLLLLALVWALTYESLGYLLLCEALLCASLAGGLLLLRRALEPLDYARRVRELLQEQNYAVRLRAADTSELALLVDEFNGLLATLHAERLKIGEQQGFLDRLLEATPAGVIVFDFDGRISLLNASARVLLGLAEPIGRPLSDWSADQPLLAQLDAMPAGESRLLQSPDGRRLRAQRGSFYDRGFARSFLLLEELTAELESSERAAHEKLIRVLAHEVNNTVAATGSVLESLLYYRSQLREADGADFATAIDAVRRRNASLGEFIERFTRVVKMPAPAPAPQDVGLLMDDILAVFREHARQRGIQLVWGRRDALPSIALDRALMEQALINIVKNAIEAAEAGPEPRSVSIDLTAQALRVSDSGAQLAALRPEQLFMPFFSTKKGGQGIGLMFVREVLLRHGFPFRLATIEGATCFEISWPTPAQGR